MSDKPRPSLQWCKTGVAVGSEYHKDIHLAKYSKNEEDSEHEAELKKHMRLNYCLKK